MKQLIESILDDEKDIINNQSIPETAEKNKIISWLDNHSPKFSAWAINRESDKIIYNISKNQIELNPSDILKLTLDDKNEIPNYINVVNGEIEIWSNFYNKQNTDELTVNSKYLKNIKQIYIKAPQIKTITFKGQIDCEQMYLDCMDLTTVNMKKCNFKYFDVHKCPNLYIQKCKFPSIKTKAIFNPSQLKSVFDKVGLNYNIIELKAY